MEQNITIVGMDVSKKTIVTGVLPAGQDRVSESKTIPNEPQAVDREVRRLTIKGPAIFIYEAGPFGYDLYRHIERMGHRCVVIAPGLIPTRPGDRVKTDRRDAEKLARLYRAGELTPVRVPTCSEEAARDLVRAREDAVTDQTRARHRLVKFLLRQGRAYPAKKALGAHYRRWLVTQSFEWPALQETFLAHIRAFDEAAARLETLSAQINDLAQEKPYQTLVRHLSCLKGIDTLGAMTLAVEIQDFSRFDKAAGLMSYTGLVSREYSSGESIRRGSITKTGNAHLRRILVEAAWSNRHKPVVSRQLASRRFGCPDDVIKIARKAQERLHRKYWRLLARGKHFGTVVTAVARELAGFVWAIGRLSMQPKTT